MLMTTPIGPPHHFLKADLTRNLSKKTVDWHKRLVYWSEEWN